MTTESRFLCAAWVAAAMATLWALVRMPLPWALGMGVGAALGVLNLHWLRAGAQNLIYNAVARTPEAAADPALLTGLGPRARFGRLRFAVRYALVGGVLYAIFMSHYVPVRAAFGGLLAAPVGVMAGAIFEGIRGWHRGNRKSS